MSYLLATDSNPGTAQWQDSASLTGGWVIFPEVPPEGTIQTNGQSGECVITSPNPGSSFEIHVEQPTRLGQELVVNWVNDGSPSSGGIFLFLGPPFFNGNLPLQAEYGDTIGQGEGRKFIALYVKVPTSAQPILAYREILPFNTN